MKYDLTRYREAYDECFPAALEELAAARGRAGWLRGLLPVPFRPELPAAEKYYALKGIGEARAFLEDAALGPKCIRLCEALSALTVPDFEHVFCEKDRVRLQYSLTLLKEAAYDREPFTNVLFRLFGGRSAAAVYQLLQKADGALPLPDTRQRMNCSTWNTEAWLEEFTERCDRHPARTDVFAHTVNTVLRGGYETHGRAVSLTPAPELITGTKVYSEELRIAPPETIFKTEFSVADEDCLVTAEKLVRAGNGRVAVLNMANRTTPGGGVEYGAGAQEESCFRRSDYFLSLYPLHPIGEKYGLARRTDAGYPLDENFGGIFSPNVTVFRGPEAEGYPLLAEPFRVNFIAAAAMNTPELHMDDAGNVCLAQQLVPAAMNRIRMVLAIAADNGMDTLVLGALGCGAFHNPPDHIARLFREALEEPAFRGRFRKAVFSVIRNRRNLAAFRAVFEPKGAQP